MKPPYTSFAGRVPQILTHVSVSNRAPKVILKIHLLLDLVLARDYDQIVLPHLPAPSKIRHRRRRVRRDLRLHSLALRRSRSAPPWNKPSASLVLTSAFPSRKCHRS